MYNALCLLNHSQEEAYEEIKRAIVINPKIDPIEEVKDEFVCISRKIAKEEPDEFYRTYKVNKGKVSPYCKY